MTVYENLFVGRELRHGPFLDRKAMIAEAKETLVGVRRGHLANRANG